MAKIEIHSLPALADSHAQSEKVQMKGFVVDGHKTVRKTLIYTLINGYFTAGARAMGPNLVRVLRGTI